MLNENFKDNVLLFQSLILASKNTWKNICKSHSHTGPKYLVLQNPDLLPNTVTDLLPVDGVYPSGEPSSELDPSTEVCTIDYLRFAFI